MFADDTAILATHTEPRLIARALNRHLLDLEDWFCKWKIALNVAKTEAVFFTKYSVSCIRYTPTNRRTPLAIWPLEGLAPGKGDGTRTGTEVTPLTQHSITKLPLATAGKEQGSRIFSLKHDTISCYPIGWAVRSPEAPIGLGNCK
ncbi:hypothetical protein TNCV_4641451 [Trichonephila clavipes]|nr:hypothetical protein TNCV_4641451 [Trichonephila clavipes]